MKKAENVAARAVRLLPNISALEERLRGEDPGLESMPFSMRPREPRGVASLAERAELPEDAQGAREELKRVLNAGAAALGKVRKEKENARLSPQEADGLEAIILLTGRPAILIQGGRFLPPPEDWRQLETVRDQIDTNLASVGRIEVDGHPALDWVGTGFMVADDVIMTNRHVAKEFARRGRGNSWTFEPGMKTRIDYMEDLACEKPAEFAIQEIIGIHQDVDMALLRVSRKGSPGCVPPKPLPIAKEPKLKKGLTVYAVGYPASDSRRNDPDVMRRIFAGIYNIKRLQPGALVTLTPAQKLMTHDCSTLGGNSGSCVIDLDSNKVVGLHFGGRYRATNYAVMLSQMTKDPLLKKAKVPFA